MGWIALNYPIFYFTLHDYGTGEVGVPEILASKSIRDLLALV